MAKAVWKGRQFQANMIRAANRGITAAARTYSEVARVSMGRSHGGVSSPPGTPPHTQTGNLRSRIVWVGPSEAGALRALYGTNVRYARAHERKTPIRIRPISAKYLTIPLSRKAAIMLRRAGRVRKIPGLSWRPARGSGVGGLLGIVKGKRIKRFEALFLLKSSVLLPPRPFLVPALTTGRALAMAAFSNAVRASLASGVAR